MSSIGDEAQRLLRAAGKDVRSGPFAELVRAISENRCDIMPRINSSGIPLGSPLGQQLFRLVQSLDAPVKAEAEAEVEDLEPCAEGELLVMNSQHKQCGVREYGDALNAQFVGLGAQVRAVRLRDSAVLGSASGDVLLHVEPSLLPPAFDKAVREAHERGARIVICFHVFTESLLKRFERNVSAMVVHRSYGIKHPKLRQIPLGCPVYESEISVHELRRRYRLPVEATIITTFGFLTAWKKFPETAAAILPLLEPGMFLQLLCSPHFMRYEEGERRLKEIVKGSSAVQLRTDFLPTQEIIERLHASDLGFTYHSVNTGSVSAATKQFVSARCPLVVTSSSHASDMLGASHVTEPGVKAFAEHVVSVAKDARKLSALRTASEVEYRRLNMRHVAEEYLKLFAELRGVHAL